jgi:hypothetical protein
MPRIQNVFHKLVSNENSTTQLLCNLLQFDDFRAMFLELIIPGIDSSEAAGSHIDAEIAYDECGRPDIRIRSENVLALIELKVRKDTSCTVNQPQEYMKFLREQNEPIRRLVFLIPTDWRPRDELSGKLRTLESIGADGRKVGTEIVTWDDLVKMIKEHVHALDKGKPFIEEFHKLLVGLGSVVDNPAPFEPEEKLRFQQVVTAIKKRSELEGFKVRREGPNESREYGYFDGVYFLNSARKDAFWFGVWGFFWEEHGFPLCFGVKDKWGAEAMRAFRVGYKGDTRPYRLGYTVGTIDKQVLDRPDIANEIWSIIEPIVEATVAARTIGGPKGDSV